jgi:mono/diheme cytochrome c family protein
MGAAKESTNNVKRVVWILLALSVMVAMGMGTALWWMRQPETTSAMRGRQLADKLGCFGCHGPEGKGGIADPTSPAGEVPDWSYATTKMFVSSPQDIREWILYGAPRRETARKYHDEHRPLVPMPAYEHYVSDAELDDLVAYFLAVSGWRAEIPDDAYEGRKIATRLGCFGCHGPSGMGGVRNPGSLKGHIPPWDGDEFEELVRNEQELREWILEGRIERLSRNPAARYFLDRQKTPMPAYHDYISDAELDLLVGYIQWLRSGADEGEQPRDAATVIAKVTGGR